MEVKYLIIGLAAFGLFGGIAGIRKFLKSGFLEDDECKHGNTFTSVKNVTATCETTTVECMDCRKILSGPKTEC